MRAHRNDGAAAPSLVTLGARDIVPPPSEVAPDTPHIDGPAQGVEDGKRFATLRAQLALKGFGLSRTAVDDGPVCFHVHRWGMVPELCDIAAVRDFAESVGVRQ